MVKFENGNEKKVKMVMKKTVVLALEIWTLKLVGERVGLGFAKYERVGLMERSMPSPVAKPEI